MGLPWDRLLGEVSLRAYPKDDLSKLEEMAMDGNPIAQANWAVVLCKGIERESDTDQAVDYFIKAAEQGLDYIQLIPGFIFENGVMVEKDIAEALRWYQMASDQGNAQATLMIAAMYQTGRDGIPVDEAKTFEWMRKSAEQGNPFAQTFLGAAYSMGFGVSKDKIAALAWFDFARSNGFQLSGSVRERLLTEMSSVEKGAAQKLTEEWGNKYPFFPPMNPIF